MSGPAKVVGGAQVVAPMLRRLALVVVSLAVLAPAAHAQSRGPLAVVPGAMTCVSVPISTPPVQTIRATDRGGGVVDLDIFVLSSSATPTMSVTRSGRDLAFSLHVPDGMASCTMSARVTGVPAGAYDVRLTTVTPTITRSDLARGTVSVR